MATKELFNVRTPDDAYRVLADHLTPSPRQERVPLDEALDRVLAEDLLSPTDLPAFPRSTMDGYAVRAADTYGASEGLPAYLTVVGECLMGQAPTVSLALGQAAVIATGGMLAPGSDAVVMVEQTQAVGADTVEVLRAVAPGENVIQVGEDVRQGDRVLPRGHLLRPQDLGGLAALGIVEVAVVPRLRVGIISSGDEVVAPDQEPGPGQVRDVNTLTVAALTRRLGHLPVPYGICKDDLAALHAVARRAWDECDVVILSAGSSVSTRDMTAEVIAALGEPGILVHGVSLRPGKPTILAVAGGKPVFGLPGNPVSCMVTYDLFVTPALHHLTGCPRPPAEHQVRARLTKNVASAPGRVDYVQVRLEERDGELWADPVFGKSNLIYTLVRSDGMVKVELDKGGLVAGELVAVTLC